MEHRTIKPSQPGLRVRDPERGRHLREDGERVLWNTYWRRRYAAGEVVEVEGEPVPAALKREKGGKQAPKSKRGG